jgi:hypothetical protein
MIYHKEYLTDKYKTNENNLSREPLFNIDFVRAVGVGIKLIKLININLILTIITK